MLVSFIVFRIIILFFEIFHISLEGLRFSFSMYQWVAPQLSVLFNLSQNIVCEGGGELLFGQSVFDSCDWCTYSFCGFYFAK